jgi:hypothetical protein
MSSDLNRYTGPVDLLDNKWNQFFCQTCRGTGVASDRFFVEVLCTHCYGAGERPVLRPHIRMDMESLSLDAYGQFYIVCLFHRFNDGHAKLLFLYNDLVWRGDRNSSQAQCYFKHKLKAQALLRLVT